MNMNNNNLSDDFAGDFELLRIEKLIEEREAYEREFLSMEPSTAEFNYQIFQYELELEEMETNFNSNDFEEDMSDPFELEDFHNLLRDVGLIREREEYEAVHFSTIEADLFEEGIFDFQIAAREESLEHDGYDYDLAYEPEDYGDYVYDQYEEDIFWNLHYLRQSQFEKPECGCAYMDYMPHDDGLCDYLDCYDYPEGPQENLNGIKFY